MKRRTIKALSLILSIVFILSLCPSVSAVGSVHEHDGQDYMPLTDAGFATEAGTTYYYFIDGSRYTAQDNLEVESGVTVYLCLNGGMLNLNGYRIINNGTLYITDCSGKKAYAHYDDNEFKWMDTMLDSEYSYVEVPGAQIVRGGSVRLDVIDNFGTLNVENVTFTRYSVDSIFNIDSQNNTVIKNCAFVANNVDYTIRKKGVSDLTITDTAFVGNTTGDIIYTYNDIGEESIDTGVAKVTVKDSVFAANTIGNCAYVNDSDRTTAEFENVTVTHNTFTNDDESHAYGFVGFWYDDPDFVIDSNRKLTLKNCSITDNISDDGEAALYAYYASVEMTGCVVQNNKSKSAEQGGAVYLGDGTTAQISDCSFITNTHTTENSSDNGCGMAICVDGSDNGYDVSDDGFAKVDISNTEFKGNAAAVCGGAVCCNQAEVTLNNCDFAGNEVKSNESRGGAIYGANSAITVTEGTFEENNTGSYGSGGAIFIAGDDAKLTCNDVTFKTNVANYGYGGAICAGTREYETNPAVELTDCTFEGLNATVTYTSIEEELVENREYDDATYGGAVYVRGALDMDGCTFYKFRVYEDGGAVNFGGKKANIKNSTFTGNYADCLGGAINLGSNESVVISGCTIKGNSSNYYGGGVHLEKETEASDVTIKDVVITENYATDFGGGVLVAYGLTLEGKCIITGNYVDGGMGPESVEDEGALEYNAWEDYEPSNLFVEEPFDIGEAGLTEGSLVGISWYGEELSSETTAVAICNATEKDYSEYFVSDKATVEIEDEEQGAGAGEEKKEQEESPKKKSIPVVIDTIKTEDGKYKVVLGTTARVLVATAKDTATGTVKTNLDGKTYVTDGETVKVEVSVTGGAFAGAEYALTYNSNYFTLVDEQGTELVTVDASAEEPVTCSNKLSGVTPYYNAETGTVTLAVSAVIANYSNGTIQLEADGRFAEDTVIGTYLFKANAVNIFADNTFTIEGKVAPNWYLAGQPVDAEPAGSVNSVLGVAPAYSAELVENYVSGQALVLVYTDCEDGNIFAWDGDAMPILADNGEYTFLADNDSNCGKECGTNLGKYVYGFIVENRAGNSLTMSDLEAKINFGTGLVRAKLNMDEYTNSRYDVNESAVVELYDAVATMGTYNVNEFYFNLLDGVCAYQNAILKADVNRDKKVDTADVALVLANYGPVIIEEPD